MSVNRGKNNTRSRNVIPYGCKHNLEGYRSRWTNHSSLHFRRTESCENTNKSKKAPRLQKIAVVIIKVLVNSFPQLRSYLEERNLIIRNTKPAITRGQTQGTVLVPHLPNTIIMMLRDYQCRKDNDGMCIFRCKWVFNILYHLFRLIDSLFYIECRYIFGTSNKI